MDLSEILQIGMTREDVFSVESEHSAAHIGSGSARVLATPWMIAFMERTARDLLANLLPEGYSSVGVHVDVRHLTPSPVGSHVRTQVEVKAIQGVIVDFTVCAWDEQELVGEGTHQRVVIEEERFLRRVAGKMAAQAGE
jgi:fluoroacetyl-CoA thioesterase